MVERKVVFNPEQLLNDQAGALRTFFGKETLPPPPQELLEFVERSSELGFTFEPYFEPSVRFTQDSNYPGWLVKPNLWFWEQIRKGNISQDAAILSGQWAAMEALQMPNYDNGKQLYENDPLGPILERLRKDKKIAAPNWCKDIPPISRFGLSSGQIKGYVVPLFVEHTKIKATAEKAEVRIPPYMSWNFRGNIAHPEWGKTDTSEWFAESIWGAFSLCGGNRDHGGLADVEETYKTSNSGHIGFRLSAVFSPSKS
jgi:hypothetical protein